MRRATKQGNTHGRKWIRDDKRLAIYLRDGLACVWCSVGVEQGVSLTLDHVVSRSAGGTHHENNLLTACMSCNARRGDRELIDFAAVMTCRDAEGSPQTVPAKLMVERLDRLRLLPLAPFREQAKALIDGRGLTAAIFSLRTKPTN